MKFISLVVLLLLSASAQAQVEKTKKIEKTFEGSSDTRMVIDHRDGPVTILPSSDGKFHIKGFIKVKAAREADANEALNNLEIQVSQTGNQISIITERHIKNWITILNKSKVTFESGVKVEDIKDIEMSVEVKMPNRVKQLDIKNKYSPITIDQDMTADIHIEQYDSEVNTQDCGGIFDLKLKYGEANLGVLENVSMELYDAEVTLSNATSFQGNSKYSNLSGGNLSQLSIESYDSEVEFGNISGNTNITDKYSNYELGNFERLTLDAYETKMTIGIGKSLMGKSKYGEYKFGTVDKVELTSSYEDEFSGERIGQLMSTSKYGEYNISTLGSELVFPESYEDEITIGRIERLTKMELNAKYLELKCNQTGGDFTVTADAKYSEIELPTRTQVRIRDKDDSKLKLEAVVGGNAGKAVINCYECEIKLN